MKYETFKTAVLQRLQSDIPDPKKISVQTVSKNNGLMLDGLIIMENGCNISPTLYLDYYYESYRAGTSFQEVYDSLLESYLDNRPSQSIDIRFFTEFENIHPKIAYRLINRKRNEKILEDIPHMDFLDLAIVFYCSITMDPQAGEATILIHNSHLGYWDITASELYQIAVENTPVLLPYRLRDMNEVLAELAGQQETQIPEPSGQKETRIPESSGQKETRIPESPGQQKAQASKSAGQQETQIPEPSGQQKARALRTPADTLYPMFVLTNQRNHYGACCILYRDVLKQFSEKTGTDFYILPSSIHEVILIPASERNCMEELSAMVREVNETQLSPDEILSDHAYYYSARKNEILMQED